MKRKYLILSLIVLLVSSIFLFGCTINQKEFDNKNTNIFSVEEYNQLEKQYKKTYIVTGFISDLNTKCYCPIDIQCGLCPTTPYLILTDYNVEFRGGDKYDVDSLNYNELYITLGGDVEDITGLELDSKYNMTIGFLEEDRSHLISYELS